jgi:hypothetical protein
MVASHLCGCRRPQRLRSRHSYELTIARDYRSDWNLHKSRPAPILCQSLPKHGGWQNQDHMEDWRIVEPQFDSLKTKLPMTANPCIRITLDTLTGLQLLMKVAVFYETRTFVKVLTTARHFFSFCHAFTPFHHI